MIHIDLAILSQWIMENKYTLAQRIHHGRNYWRNYNVEDILSDLATEIERFDEPTGPVKRVFEPMIVEAISPDPSQ